VLGDELHGGKEVVEEESPLGCIELVQLSGKLRLVELLIADVLPDVGPVLPLDVRVVVLPVFS